VSVGTLKRRKGGQFVIHVKAPRATTHTLASVIPAIEGLLGNTVERLYTDAGNRSDNVPLEYKFKDKGF
jgi:IS5 family transposase